MFSLLWDTAYKALQIKERLTAEREKEPTAEEIAKEMGLTRENVVIPLRKVVHRLTQRNVFQPKPVPVLFIADLVHHKKRIVAVTQQYTKGLGDTVPAMKEALGEFTPMDKTSFSALRPLPAQTEQFRMSSQTHPPEQRAQYQNPCCSSFWSQHSPPQ